MTEGLVNPNFLPTGVDRHIGPKPFNIMNKHIVFGKKTSLDFSARGAGSEKLRGKAATYSHLEL